MCKATKPMCYVCSEEITDARRLLFSLGSVRPVALGGQLEYKHDASGGRCYGDGG